MTFELSNAHSTMTSGHDASGFSGFGEAANNTLPEAMFTSSTIASPTEYPSSLHTHFDTNDVWHASCAIKSIAASNTSNRELSTKFQTSMNIANRIENSASGEKRTSQHGIRQMIRRASISIRAKTRPRRNTLETHGVSGLGRSAELETRPSTPTSRWQIIRNAASFKHSRGQSDESRPVPYSNLHLRHALPCAGSFVHDSVDRTVQNAVCYSSKTYTDKTDRAVQRNPRPKHLEEPQGDNESGVGIAITTTDEAVATISYNTEQPLVCKIDFIDALPVELAIQILSNLDAKSLCDVQLVSKAWRQISSNNHVWREAYLRDWSQGYAISQNLKAGDGYGVPTTKLDMPWKTIHRARKQLKSNWSRGKAQHIYLTGHLDSIYCVQFDEKKIITGSRDKTIRIWNQHTCRCDLIIGPPNIVQERNIMYDSAGAFQHKLPVSDASGRQGYCPPTLSFPMYHNASILCLQYDDEILVTGSSDGTALIHDMRDGYKPIMRLVHHTAAILDLAFDDRHIVTCSKDITVCVWDRRTGAMLKQLRGHTGPVNAVQMRGNTIVSCSGDFKVKLWNIDTGKCIREFLGHTKGLACSQFSDDAKLIASAGNDKTIRIWDANTGECIREIAAHENLVRSLHIDSVSGRLISGSYDQDIKVFDIASGRLLLDFPKWHSSWVLGAKSDYRRIISTGQDPKILVMDFGADIDGIEWLEG